MQTSWTIIDHVSISVSIFFENAGPQVSKAVPTNQVRCMVVNHFVKDTGHFDMAELDSFANLWHSFWWWVKYGHAKAACNSYKSPRTLCQGKLMLGKGAADLLWVWSAARVWRPQRRRQENYDDNAGQFHSAKTWNDWAQVKKGNTWKKIPEMLWWRPLGWSVAWNHAWQDCTQCRRWGVRSCPVSIFGILGCADKLWKAHYGASV